MGGKKKKKKGGKNSEEWQKVAKIGKKTKKQKKTREKTVKFVTRVAQNRASKKKGIKPGLCNSTCRYLGQRRVCGANMKKFCY